MHVLEASALIFLINLPFGYWRAGQRKLSRKWFLSVHAPVPLVVAVRMLFGIGWQLAVMPWMIGAFFGGQVAGGLVRRARA